MLSGIPSLVTSPALTLGAPQFGHRSVVTTTPLMNRLTSSLPLNRRVESRPFFRIIAAVLKSCPGFRGLEMPRTEPTGCPEDKHGRVRDCSIRSIKPPGRLHYSIRTEDARVPWTKMFFLSHDPRLPREMGEPEVVASLTHLAVHHYMAASTRNHADGPIRPRDGGQAGDGDPASARNPRRMDVHKRAARVAQPSRP